MKRSSDIFSADGHLNEEGVALYVEAITSGRTNALPPPVLDHVAECLQCKKDVTELYTILRTEPSHKAKSRSALPTDAGDWVRIPHGIFRIAALLAVMILAGFAGYLFVLKSPPESAIHGTLPGKDTAVTTERVFDSTNTKADRAHAAETARRELSQYAANFAVEPNLEDLVGVELRSEGIQMNAPTPESDAGKELLFQWKTTERQPLSLSILDNQGNVVRSIHHVSSPIQVKTDFTPGLYYWKLETDAEVVYVGKFYVGRK